MDRKSTDLRTKSTSSQAIDLFIKGKESRNRSKMESIRKLYEKLHNDSNSSLYDSTNSTDIQVKDGEEKPDTKNKPNSSLIIIDDGLVTSENHYPLKCSTPLSKHSFKSSKTSENKNNNTNTHFNEEEKNLTKEINRDAYLTIDLTNETLNATDPANTVIDLRNILNLNDLDVTVINTKRKNNDQMKNFSSGIENFLDSSERGNLLEYETKTIFNGCSGPSTSKNSPNSFKNGISKFTETIEDTYIKEVILGRPSRNSIGSNIYNPEINIKNKTGLRLIVIDGSNVAMQHTEGRRFSVKGLKICIDYFLQRRHTVIAYVPYFRCKHGKSSNGKLLNLLEGKGLVVYTPSREIQGRMITSYDDRYFIAQYAAKFDGIIVSGDNYRDLLNENPWWRNVIENRLLQFTWVGDMIVFPQDPRGRSGPTLEQFLRHPS